MNVFWAPSGELPKEASSPEEISRFVVEAAVHAPSVNNTQPWWFSKGDGDIGVHADVERRLRVADPDGREMMISCGAALFTARVAMRYLGFVPAVSVLPDPDLPNLVARIRYGDEQAAPVEYERVLFAGDLLHFTFQLYDVEYRSPADADAEHGSRTRAEWLDRVESQGVTLATAHVPPSPFVHLVREGELRAARAR